MDRDISPDTREIPPTHSLERGQERQPSDPPRTAHEREKSGPERAREDRLTDGQRAALFEIGRFRTVAVGDLANHLYQGKATQMQQDLRFLTAMGLIQRRTALVAQGRAKLAVLVLTKAGKRVIEGRGLPESQAVYAGFVKPAEVAHDAAIYRMFHKEAEKIAGQGGIIRRVVLDYELKRTIYAPLAKARNLPPLEYARKQAEVAQANGLKVVSGKIPLPDLRIEYDTAQGERTHVDLELATHHYHGAHLQLKAAAGFKIYAEGGGCMRTPVNEEREITAEILSL